MTLFVIGSLTGFVAGIVLHFRLTREQRKAFDVAVERMRAANARLASMDRTLTIIKAMLHRSRGHRNLEISAVALPIAADRRPGRQNQSLSMNSRGRM